MVVIVAINNEGDIRFYYILLLYFFFIFIDDSSCYVLGRLVFQ